MVYYNTCDIVSVDILKFAKRAGIPVRIIHSHNTDTQFKKRWFHYLTENIIGKILKRLQPIYWPARKKQENGCLIKANLL